MFGLRRFYLLLFLVYEQESLRVGWTEPLIKNMLMSHTTISVIVVVVVVVTAAMSNNFVLMLTIVKSFAKRRLVR